MRLTMRGLPAGKPGLLVHYSDPFSRGEFPMNRKSGRRCFYPSVLCALAALLVSSTLAHAQPNSFYYLDWTERFNNSATSSDTQDNWVANSFTAGTNSKIVSITIPIGETFTNKPITALIYQGFDLYDPTAGGGLLLMAQQTTTFSSTVGVGNEVTVTFDNPVTLNSGDIFYAAVLIPAVGPSQYPFRNDASRVIGNGRSFFDTGLTYGGAYDINQLPDNSANITTLGGTHPIVGPGIQSAGTLALWANGVAP